MTLHPQFVTDEKGKKVSVILPFKEYLKLIADKEEAEDIRLYNEVKSRNEKSIPFEQYLKERNAKRKP